MKQITKRTWLLATILASALLLTAGASAYTLNQINYTSNTTINIPGTVNKIQVEMWGGGGAGGGVSSGGQGGGGGGGAFSALNITVVRGQNLSVNIGPGGVGATQASGTDGGDTWVNSTGQALAKGGKGGVSGNSGGGAGGAGGDWASSIGTIRFSGGNGTKGAASGAGGGGAGTSGPGGNASSITSASDGGNGTAQNGGNGGNQTGLNVNGQPGNTYGGAGSGGENGGGNAAGATGAQGLVRVTFFAYDNLTIYANDQFDNSSINTFNASVTFNGTTTTYTTSTGVIITNILVTNTNPANVTVAANNYFNKTYLQQSVATEIDTALFQAQASFTTQEIITGVNVPSFTVNISGTTSNGTPMYLKAGTYNVTWNRTGWYSNVFQITVPALSNSTYNFSGAYQYALNISAKDILTSAAISTFNITLLSNQFSYVTTAATTNGSIILGITNGTFNISAGGVSYSTSQFNLTVPILAGPSLTNTSLSLYPNPSSININVYDESSGALLNFTTVNITISGSTISVLNSTSTGNLYSSGLSPDNYTVLISATNYTLRSYFVTLGSSTNVNLNAYLSQSASTVQFDILNFATGQVIPNAVMSMARLIGGTWTTVDSRISDITGVVQFSYVPTIQYRFTITATGYSGVYDPSTNTASPVFYLNPVLLSVYQVKLLPSTSITNNQDFNGLGVTYTPTTFVTNVTTNLTFTLTSVSGTLLAYNATVTYPLGNGSSASANLNGSNANGGTLVFTFTPVATSLYDTVNLSFGYTLTSGISRSFNYQFPITGATSFGLFTYNHDNTYGLGSFERIAIVVIACMIAAGLLAPFLGPIGAGLIALLVMGASVTIGFMPFWAAAVSFLAGFAIITFAGGRT